MNIEWNLPPEVAEIISDKLLEKLLPHLQQHQQDEVLKIEQAVTLIGKSKQQIYQWVNKSAHGASDFPYWKAGKSLMFSRNELIAWMKKNGKPSNR